MNFWQDTIRKDIGPQDYLKNLDHDLEHYFIFEVGKKMACSLLKDRKKEVDAFTKMKSIWSQLHF